jgi:adenylylsulfate kinase-like enzyme
LCPDRFVEIYVQCSLEKCEQRDPKGLYKKARAGEIADFTGISAPYEEPEHPELVVRTDESDVATCARTIIEYLQARKNIV